VEDKEHFLKTFSTYSDIRREYIRSMGIYEANPWLMEIMMRKGNKKEKNDGPNRSIRRAMAKRENSGVFLIPPTRGKYERIYICIPNEISGFPTYAIFLFVWSFFFNGFQSNRRAASPSMGPQYQGRLYT